MWLQQILQNILENQTFQGKFIMADFYKMDFMKEIVILVKVGEMYKDEMCKILKFANHCLLLEK